MKIRAKTVRAAIEFGHSYTVTLLQERQHVELAPGATEACVVFTVDNHLGTFAVPLARLAAGDAEVGLWVEAIPIARNDRPAWVGLGGEATM